MSQLDISAVLPQAVAVRFPRYDTDSGSPVFSGIYYTLPVTLAALALPEFANVKPNSGTQLLRVGQDATYTGGVLQNGAALQAYANQVATDWYRHQASPLDMMWDGCVPYQPEGLSGDIEWDAAPGKVTAHVRRPVWQPREMNLGPLLMAAAASGGGGTVPGWTIGFGLASYTAVQTVPSGPGGFVPSFGTYSGINRRTYGPGITVNTGTTTTPLTVTGVGPTSQRPGTVLLIRAVVRWILPNGGAGVSNTFAVQVGGFLSTTSGLDPGIDSRPFVVPDTTTSLFHPTVGVFMFMEDASEDINIVVYQQTGFDQQLVDVGLTVVVFNPVIASVTPRALTDNLGNPLTDSSGNPLTDNGM